MKFDLQLAADLLMRTPHVLRAMLKDLPPEWLSATEGGKTWSPFDVLGHLIHGEKTDWIPRARIILNEGESRPFEKFDRTAMFRESKGKTLAQLLDEFEMLRRRNLGALAEMKLRPTDMTKTGTHPQLGRVTLEQLLATWVAHDQDHLVQIARTLAKQYEEAVGPWKEYLSVMDLKSRS